MLSFLIAIIGAVRNPCKDVTFGGCILEDDDVLGLKVLSKTSQETVQLCNVKCYDMNNCTTYRYNKQSKECTLVSAEYRAADCNIRAGPVNKTATDCLGQTSNQMCDSHLEEDCEYSGELLHREPKGKIISSVTCQIQCDAYPDCKYWIFHGREKLCILRRDGRRTCNVWAGPKQPSYDYCQNLPMP